MNVQRPMSPPASGQAISNVESNRLAIIVFEEMKVELTTN